MQEDNKRWTVLIIRVFLGGMFLMAGYFHIAQQGLAAFSSELHEQFSSAPLPGVFLTLFGYTLPVVEFVAGALLLVGLYRRLAFVVIGFTLVFLSLGQFMIQEYNVAANNAVYLLIALTGLYLLRKPCFAVDSFRDTVS